MLLTVLLLVAAAVLLGVACLALWEFWNEAEVEGAAHVLTATPARTPTPPTLDRQQRIASRRAPRRPQRPPTPIPPPELRRFPASYGPVDEDGQMGPATQQAWARMMLDARRGAGVPNHRHSNRITRRLTGPVRRPPA